MDNISNKRSLYFDEESEIDHPAIKVGELGRFESRPVTGGFNKR